MRDPRRTDKELVAQYFGAKAPNRERIGCPDKSELTKLGRGLLDPADPLYDHVTGCPACFREAEAIRQSTGADARRRMWMVTGAAAAALLVGVFIFSRPAKPPADVVQTGPKSPPVVEPMPPKMDLPPASPPTKKATERPVAIVATLDLRAFTPARGTAPVASADTPRIRPQRQKLTLILPVASEPGSYTIRLMDSDLRPSSDTIGSAAVRDGRTILTLVLDASVKPGMYSLALKHEGDEWRLYPLEVRE